MLGSGGRGAKVLVSALVTALLMNACGSPPPTPSPSPTSTPVPTPIPVPIKGGRVFQMSQVSDGLEGQAGGQLGRPVSSVE